MKQTAQGFTTFSLHERGFTLVELLVVIAVMSLVGVYTFANYKSFGEDQNLKNAALDIQGILRSAQISASTNTKCSSKYGATWQVVYTDTKNLTLQCKEPDASSFVVKKTLTLGTNITVAVSGNNISCPSPSVANFTPVSGVVDFGATSCTKLTFALTNSKTTSTQTVVIDTGGGIHAQ